MRKVVGVAAVTFVALMVCGAAQATEMLGKFSISPFGGLVIPIGDFADTDPSIQPTPAAKTGFCVGGALEYGLTENVVIGGRIAYNQFGFDEEVVAEDLPEGAGIDAKWTVVELFGAYVKLLMSAGNPTRPYVRGGVFVGKPKLTIEATLDGESGELEGKIANSLGLDAGVGVAHMFSENIGGFFEGSISHLMSDGKDADITVDGEVAFDGEAGFNAQWITVRGGLTFFFGK